MACKTDPSKTNCNERTADLSLPFGGNTAVGQITTNLDNGTARWYPKISNGLYNDNIYLESKRNADGTYSAWTQTGEVFNEIRATSPSIAAAYSSNDILSTAFYSAGTKTGSPVGTLNSGRINVFNTNGAPQTAKNLKLPGTTNVAPPQPLSQDQIDAQKANAALGDPTTIEGVSIEVGTAKGSQRTFGDLCYPVDLRKNRQDRIKFSMIEYAPATINPILGNQTITRDFNSKNSLGSVTLPIQPSITDNNSVDWSGSTLNAVQALAAGGSMTLMNQRNFEMFGRAGATLLEQAFKQLASNSSYSDALKVIMAQEAVGAQNLLSRASGSILNPNLELLFNGPSLRPFAFTFRLSPRDENEAKEVKKIIRFFKQGMAVKRTVEDVFLKAPNVFRIGYTTFEGEKEVPHPAINRFKECALLSCDVDYTPDGTYMTYVDKTITSYQISLRFSELEPIYEDDYQSLDNLAYNKQGEITNKQNLDSGGIGY